MQKKFPTELEPSQLVNISPENPSSLQGHTWVQRGITVSCQSCPKEHGFFIAPNQMLRLKDGKFVIETLE